MDDGDDLVFADDARSNADERKSRGQTDHCLNRHLDDFVSHPSFIPCSTTPPCRCPRKHKRPIVDRAIVQRQLVEHVILVEPPRLAVALFREGLDGALDVARGKIDQRDAVDIGSDLRHAGGIAVPIHMGEQPAHPTARQIAFQRPGGIGVAERISEVRHVGEHRAFVAGGLRQIDLAAVHRQPQAAEQLQPQPRRRHHDIGRDVAPRAQPQARRGQRLDLVRHDLGTAAPDCLEQIGIGHEAHALVPRIVARVEMFFDVIVRAEALAHLIQDATARLAGLLPGVSVEEDAEQDVAPAHDAIGLRLRQEPPHALGETILRRERDDEARRALQHGYVGASGGQRRHQRHRRRAAADHHDALARRVETVRPRLRMHQRAAERIDAGKVRHETSGIIVISGADEQETAGDVDRRIAPCDLEGPGRVGGRPCGADRLVAEANLSVETVLFRRVSNIVEDRGAVGDRILAEPRPESIAQREHVGIRTDAGITEEIPGAADRVAAFEDGEAFARQARL